MKTSYVNVIGNNVARKRMFGRTFVKMNSIEYVCTVDFEYKTCNPIGTFVKIDFFRIL